MKPEDGKYTRKGEKDGKRLTPGERAINWAKAVAIIVPLIGIGAVADEPIKKWFTGGATTELPEAVEGTFEDWVQHSFEKYNAKFLELEEKVERVESKSHRDDHQLSDRVKKIESLVN